MLEQAASNNAAGASHARFIDPILRFGDIPQAGYIKEYATQRERILDSA